MPNLGGPELILLLIIVMFLFGAKRMPDMARSLGRSMRIFKSEIKQMQDLDEDGFDDKTGKPMPSKTSADDRN